MRSEGLEPPPCYGLPPQGSASTNSATSAWEIGTELAPDRINGADVTNQGWRDKARWRSWLSRTSDGDRRKYPPAEPGALGIGPLEAATLNPKLCLLGRRTKYALPTSPRSFIQFFATPENRCLLRIASPLDGVQVSRSFRRQTSFRVRGGS